MPGLSDEQLQLHEDNSDGGVLSWKYKEAKQGAAESAKAFAKLHNSADPDIVYQWEAQVELS
ncbi:uncharacterized protein F5147DRAFT_767177 [Suillus discolor]|uniref:Uncharacterized protein n=1 Tax=Suillus discolor TaxID=1912936 RepID=A0A9P7K0I1_9AGAM|nr:uncharacterized protein F5147DRAFT_767177 [Suillus discolor]KAG2119706.1 hypothetical protein F5147DRAFT_767177 [Suillus discolor]